jgi:hypothetical protein
MIKQAFGEESLSRARTETEKGKRGEEQSQEHHGQHFL